MSSLVIEAMAEDGDFREGAEEYMSVLRDADWTKRRGMECKILQLEFMLCVLLL